MITSHTAEMFIGIITFFVAYLVVITISNMFRAWVAYEMGDETGVRLGFLTPNPMVHIDPIGLFFLFTFYFGWGRMVPINPLLITAPYRTLKLAAAYLSDTVMNFMLSVLGIIALLAIFDVNILLVMRYMVLTYNVSHLPIANMYPGLSSLTISIGFIVFAFVYLNVVLGTLYFIINFSNYLLFVLANRYDKIAQYAHYITIGLPILLILFFSPLLRLLSVYLISHIGLIIAHVIGIAG
ncbi:MAG TPA: hypothetical protein VLB80_02700 [Candidatus Babeliales bacterium]|nr:hypothetical protein [Candidatus Babeliales bacterium]